MCSMRKQDERRAAYQARLKVSARAYETIRKEYRSGDTMQVVADRWGITRQRVEQIVNAGKKP